MTYKEIRQEARDCLKGKWLMAALITLLASLMGMRIESYRLEINFNQGTQSVPPIGTDEYVTRLLEDFPLGRLLYSLIPNIPLIVVIGLALTVIGIVVTQGYRHYIMNLAARADGTVDDLFSQFHKFGKVLGLGLLTALYVSWPLLLLIPITFICALMGLPFLAVLCALGLAIPCIIATYRYAMAPYILLENPELPVFECLEASKRLMDGHKGELFTLRLTFIGWELLSSLTFGIGSLFLTPYICTADVIFYWELQGHYAFTPEQPQTSAIPEYL